MGHPSFITGTGKKDLQKPVVSCQTTTSRSLAGFPQQRRASRGIADTGRATRPAHGLVEKRDFLDTVFFG